MATDPQAAARRDYRLWQVIAWGSFLVLAACVVWGLSTVFPRVDAIDEFLDDPAAAPGDLSAPGLGKSFEAARLSILVGTPAAFLWLVARVMCLRTRKSGRAT